MVDEVLDPFLLLASYGQECQEQEMIRVVSEEMLAEIIGTTRATSTFSYINSRNWASFITMADWKCTIPFVLHAVSPYSR